MLTVLGVQVTAVQVVGVVFVRHPRMAATLVVLMGVLFRRDVSTCQPRVALGGSHCGARSTVLTNAGRPVRWA